ncbi:hypothetical protein PALB_21740 [Pseudoalteromonas luteoviolacea B = ATCC 29581]|nr:hypothetical protein PALB_21740 [Pseudoalteromonas luteoviolacea B = ATCC 29581]
MVYPSLFFWFNVGFQIEMRGVKPRVVSLKLLTFYRLFGK